MKDSNGTNRIKHRFSHPRMPSLWRHFARCQPSIAAQTTHTSATEADLFYSTSMDSELFPNAKNGNLDGVYDCLRRGANVNAKNKYGQAALMFASAKGYLDAVRALLNRDEIDVNIKTDEDGYTALTLASAKGHSDVVRALLRNRDESDANINKNDGNTALVKASASLALKECGVFGVANDKYLGVDVENRDEWVIKGKNVVTMMLETNYKKRHGSSRVKTL